MMPTPMSHRGGYDGDVLELFPIRFQRQKYQLYPLQCALSSKDKKSKRQNEIIALLGQN